MQKSLNKKRWWHLLVVSVAKCHLNVYYNICHHFGLPSLLQYGTIKYWSACHKIVIFIPVDSAITTHIKQQKSDSDSKGIPVLSQTGVNTTIFSSTQSMMLPHSGTHTHIRNWTEAGICWFSEPLPLGRRDEEEQGKNVTAGRVTTKKIHWRSTYPDVDVCGLSSVPV